jgi:hypothetical protein
MKTASVPTLASYPGILVEVWVPRNFDESKLDAAIRKMKTDIRASAKKHLPAGVRIRVEEML